MKRKKLMSKSNFIRGAFITTLGIVITKILGILYVIPFYAVIGDEGGALYGYAYTIYLLFMSLSSAGIPLAISKLVSEYQTLGYYNAKKRAFIIGKKIAVILGFVCFLILIFCAPLMAKLVFGDLASTSMIKDVTFVIRVIATAILVVPILSVYRGYFEGHRFMEAPSISQVIEQLIRVLIIMIGSFLAYKVFKLSLAVSVGVALLGATLGAVGSYLYLLIKKRKNNSKFNDKIMSVNEPIITNKQIFKKLVIYAVPFIMIDVFKSLYSYIDMNTLIKCLVKNAYFLVSDAEVVMSIFTTWGAKFNMVILAVSSGIIVSLIPNLTQSVVKKDKKEIESRINQALSVLFFLTIPMTIGVSFLASPIWQLFYGSSKYGVSVLSYFVFVGLFMALFTALVSIVQVLKDYKTVFWSLFIGVVLKALLNGNLITAFYKMGLPAYYGAISASILGYLVSFIICFMMLHFKYKISYEKMIENFVNILCGAMVMIIVLFVCKMFIPIVSSTRWVNFFIILVYAVIGSTIYFVFTYYTGTIKAIFGKRKGKLLKKSR